MTPFDIANQVSTSAADHWDDIDVKDYVPFVINRALSYHLDTVMLANEMNSRAQIPKQWQYDFYRMAIQPKKKRFSKWSKPDADALIELVSQAYQVNRTKAISIASLLNQDQINNLRLITDYGGR